MRRTILMFKWGLHLMFFMTIHSCNNSRDISEDPVFVEAEQEWRAERDQEMRSPTSWLTIAGLFWLDEGENTFGTDPTNKIKIPAGSASPFAGKFILNKVEIRVVSSSGTTIKNEEKVIKEKTLRSDRNGKPDILELNDFRMWVIHRGDRFAIRMRDLNATRFKNYNGLNFYPPRKKYQINAEFIPYSPPKIETLATVVGIKTMMVSLGYVKFMIDGKECCLDAFETEPKSKTLFFVFRDETSGQETYGASRFLEADILDDGTVDLNFNRAENPPCGYTPYATCPLPPPQNILSVRIEAGEKIYKKSHDNIRQ